jgi:hypothetical protein
MIAASAGAASRAGSGDVPWRIALRKLSTIQVIGLSRNQKRYPGGTEESG